MPTIQQRLQAGWRSHQSGQVQQAEAIYRSVLAEVPGNADALIYLGIAQFDQRQFAASVDSYRKAIEIGRRNPIAWNNLGNSYRMMGEIEQADECLEEALRQQPDYLSALKNRGTLWVWAGEIRRGLQWYERGLQIDPQHAELHRNLGVIYLLLGDFERGWPEYRWRWRMPGMGRPRVAAPRWQGENLQGRTILLYPEQGLGDAIQFVRGAAVLRDQGAHVLLQCPHQLVALFSSVPGVERLLSDRLPVPHVDYHASLIEVVDVYHGQSSKLPVAAGLFGDRGGYLTVSDALIDYWRDWLQVNTSGRRIGINWQGNSQHHADVYRSVRLSAFEPLMGIPDIDWISLQFGEGSEQISEVAFGDQLVRLPDHVDQTEGSFTDTAAILKSLDLVITTDTAVAHLAGAVGTEVWLLLGKVPDWRWLMEGETTPWYPTMRLFRQVKMGHWEEVIEDVAKRLTG